MTAAQVLAAASRLEKGERQAQLLGELQRAGSSGLSAPELAAQLAVTPALVYALMGRYRKQGLVWSNGRRGSVRFYARSVATPVPGACVGTVIAAPRRVAPNQPPAWPYWICRPATAQLPARKPAPAESTTTGNAQVVVCPHGEDRRYAPAPGYEGEFMAEWRRLRAGGADGPEPAARVGIGMG